MPHFSTTLVDRLELGMCLLAIAGGARAQILGDLNCIKDPAKCPDTLTFVHSFSNLNGANGFMPMAGLTLGDDGNFYGTTQWGGAVDQNNGRGYGTAFRMSPGGTITTLHVFTNGTDGEFPKTALVKGPDGTVWGTTSEPGVGKATIFKIAPDSTFTSFGNLPGWAGDPNALCFSSDGNLYGTMVNGGNGLPGGGSFFQFTTDGIATMLYTFSFHPSGIVEGDDGYFYGTTGNSSGGLIFRISPSGDLTILHTFSTSDLIWTSGVPLTAGGDGYFYGVSFARQQSVYRVDTSGNVDTVVNLSNSYLSGQSTALFQGSDGMFYAATEGGAIYSVSPDGTLTTLYALGPPPQNMTLAGGTGITQLAFGPGGGLYGVFSIGGPGCQNAAPSTCFSTEGGAVFEITTAVAGAPPSGPNGPPTSKLDAIDPNNSTLLPFLPLPSLGVEWNPRFYQAFADYPLTVSALAADGVTPLIIRWRFSKAVGSVTFSLSDSACAATRPQTCENTGTFLCLDPFDCGLDPNNPLTVTATAHPLKDGTYMAFALMQAPIDFVRPSSATVDAMLPNRTLKVTATLAAGNGSPQMQSTLPLTLWRPPVALLHGIWSNACTWKLPIQTDNRYFVYPQDYEPTNSVRFTVNALQPQRAINGALAKMRSRNIAATQADFVGHSMGGILARLYTGNANSAVPYQRPENLGLGDIHKLITLDSPHLGSSLANALVDGNNDATDIGVAFEEITSHTPVTKTCNPQNSLSSLLPSYCVTCGALLDLSQGSAALSGMPDVNVPSHVIVGRGGAAAVADSSGFVAGMSSFLGPASVVAEAIAGLGPLYQFTYFGTDDHDVIVSATSQTGIVLSRDQITYLDSHIPVTWAVHFSVTGEKATSDAVVGLINAPTNSTAFAPLPATPVVNAQ
jgi:uncharacterized repeat protein (TIGR03803 family)